MAIKEFVPTDKQIVAHLKSQKKKEEYRHSSKFLKKQAERRRKKKAKVRSVYGFLIENREEVESELKKYVADCFDVQRREISSDKW